MSYLTEVPPTAFRICSEEDLLAAFRPKDRTKIILPRLFVYPIHVNHYFRWSDPSGSSIYMVIRKRDWHAPRGIIFKRGDKGSHLTTSGLCDWCHSYGPSDQIGMLTVKLNPRKTIGMMLCLDLSCIDKVEIGPNLTRKPFQQRAQELHDRMTQFFSSVRNEILDTESNVQESEF